MGAPTMETLSCDLKGPNADMNKFWQERNNSEWTEVGKGEADKFAEKWGSSRQRVESCLNELKTNPDDKTCLEGIDMVATFGHCLKKPEKQVCGECGLMKIRNDQPLVLNSTAQFPAPEKDFHILVMCIDVATWSYEIDQNDFLFANHKLRTMANGDTDPHVLITDVVPADCLTGKEITTTGTSTTTTTNTAAATTTTTSAVLASTTALVSTTTAVGGLIQCAALTAQVTDQWCIANCNHVTPFCPSQLCRCSSATTTADASTTTANDATTSIVDTTAAPTTTMEFSTTIISVSSTTGQESPTTTAGGVAMCRALTSQATDEWCTSSCNHSPPFCPSEFCWCGTGSSRRLRGR